MFVERMEVLEYRPKFEVELSTFESTITETPRKLALLPCQWKYWHRAKNRLRNKTGFGMYNSQNVEKSGFGQSVCLSDRLSCCRFSRELSQA